MWVQTETFERHAAISLNLSSSLSCGARERKKKKRNSCVADYKSTGNGITQQRWQLFIQKHFSVQHSDFFFLIPTNMVSCPAALKAWAGRTVRLLRNVDTTPLWFWHRPLSEYSSLVSTNNLRNLPLVNNKKNKYIEKKQTKMSKGQLDYSLWGERAVCSPCWGKIDKGWTQTGSVWGFMLGFSKGSSDDHSGLEFNSRAMFV